MYRDEILKNIPFFLQGAAVFELCWERLCVTVLQEKISFLTETTPEVNLGCHNM
jgi:hypothetical protein